MSERAREVVSFIIRVSMALGETSREKIRRCCLLKSQKLRGGFGVGRGWKTKERNK